MCPLIQRPGVTAGHPAVHPQLTEFERVAGPAQRPAGIERLVNQIEQRCLGGRVDSAWDPPTYSQPSFPSTIVSLTAISVTVADNRSTSALACSSS